MPPSLAVFQEQRHRRFGRSNPEHMRLELWEWILREGYSPYTIREHFGVGMVPEGGPDWCEGDLGQTRTELPDGRLICVGGEHEDSYDPDFSIYNHVIVRTPADGIEIYGYPRDLFPPTDFHTATLVGNQLILIGCLGYPEDRRPGFTPVFTLDLETYRIEPFPTSGDSPGWISEHLSRFDAEDASITISGGQVWDLLEEQPILRRSPDEFRLHLADGVWERLTDRSDWREFMVHPFDPSMASFEKYLFTNNDHILLPRNLPFEALPPDLTNTSTLQSELDLGSSSIRTFVIQGVVVRTISEPFGTKVLVEGSLPEQTLAQLLDDLRTNLEAVFEVESCTVTVLR